MRLQPLLSSSISGLPYRKTRGPISPRCALSTAPPCPQFRHAEQLPADRPDLRQTLKIAARTPVLRPSRCKSETAPRVARTDGKLGDRPPDPWNRTCGSLWLQLAVGGGPRRKPKVTEHETTHQCPRASSDLVRMFAFERFRRLRPGSSGAPGDRTPAG